jgi:hypothetical protein
VIRFQADADLKTSIRKGLIRRNPAIDFQPAASILSEGLSDNVVLALAAADERILVSHDLSTMPLHFKQFVQTRTSPGLILIPQRLPIRHAIEDLLLIWEASEEAEWQNQILYLPFSATGVAGQLHAS